jgi:hypothetical protein
MNLPPSSWHLLTRLGEAQILLPAALAAGLWLARRGDGRPFVAGWLGLLALTTLVTTVSKVAFIGWGVGIAELNFTGFSGHAMFAAAVFPPLLGVLAAPQARGARVSMLGLGYALALAVAASRVVVGAHSVSEAVAGFALGALASGGALVFMHLPAAVVGIAAPVVLATWLTLTTAAAPPSRTHDWVTRLSLQLSGRSTPYTRRDLLRELHRNRAALAPAACEGEPSCAPTTDRRRVT